MELTDADGRIVWAADYRVWGEATVRKTGTDGLSVSGHTPAPPPIEQPFRFQGQQFDEETGLHYNRFRYYDPGVGRFVSQDPIGLRGGVNLFAYGPNSINWIDPWGLAAIKNKTEGDRRQEIFNEKLRQENPNANIQCECYLRDSSGRSVKDPVTGERRRVDNAVIENNKARTYEVTSSTADKTSQLDKEQRILDAGGAYVRDRSNGQLVPVSGPSTIIRIP